MLLEPTEKGAIAPTTRSSIPSNLRRATIDNEVQEIQQDQDVIDQLGVTDDETVTQRRDRMIDGVKLKLTKVNKDRAENERRTEQIQTELSRCLADAK